MDLAQAAEILGVSQREIRSLAGRGKLEVMSDADGPASRPMVSAASVQRILRHQQSETTT